MKRTKVGGKAEGIECKKDILKLMDPLTEFDWKIYDNNPSEIMAKGVAKQRRKENRNNLN